jgi:hypothetical protein
MKLPIAGGGNPKVPSRSATHLEIEFAKLARLGMDVEEIAEDGAPLDVGALIDLAADNGKLVSHYYAGAALASDVALSSERPVQLVFCAGKCQSWGALDCLDRAAERWEARRDKGQPLFDIVARKCLDRCADAAVLEVRTPDGTAVVTRATPDLVDEALATALP